MSQSNKSEINHIYLVNQFTQLNTKDQQMIFDFLQQKEHALDFPLLIDLTEESININHHSSQKIHQVNSYCYLVSNFSESKLSQNDSTNS